MKQAVLLNLLIGTLIVETGFFLNRKRHTYKTRHSLENRIFHPHASDTRSIDLASPPMGRHGLRDLRHGWISTGYRNNHSGGDKRFRGGSVLDR